MKPRKRLPRFSRNPAEPKIRVQLSIKLEKRYWDAIRDIAERGFGRVGGKKLAVCRAVETLIVAALVSDVKESESWSDAQAKEAGLSIVHASWIRGHEEA